MNLNIPTYDDFHTPQRFSFNLIHMILIGMCWFARTGNNKLKP